MTSAAIWTARELVGNEPFAVLLANDVIDNPVPGLKQMVSVLDQLQCSVIAAQVIEGKMPSSYGVLDAQLADRFNGRCSRSATWWKSPSPRDPRRTWP
jgi:UTP--glucose-1-phosphate uridylyltransferase